MRSEHYKGHSEQLIAARDMLNASIGHDSKDLRACLAMILETARVTQLDRRILKSATAFEQRMDMQLPDAIVLASVIAELETRAQGESCFLNENSKDFDDPDIVNMLTQQACEIFFRFDAGLSYLQNRTT